MRERVLSLENELDNAAHELAERYEEINLLYSISEILGRTIELSEAASVILKEVSATVGARKGAILICDNDTQSLIPVSAVGVPLDSLPPRISLTDNESISVRTLKGSAVVLDANTKDVDDPFRHGAMLAIPILWTNTTGVTEFLGVITLSDRRENVPFSAGDIKLVLAVATQVGSAIQNAKLIKSSIEQQRLLREVQLAHDLQMKLLPKVSVVEPNCKVGARVIPAESVGGDFYHLFKLSEKRVGVMIGDVSSHGYSAALIMALTLSAAAIHAQDNPDPKDVLGGLANSLRDELYNTEMFISLFYAIIDREAGTLTYANAGHPHAFVFGENGRCERLRALDPPVGMVDDPPSSSQRSWDVNKDRLVLFTDGFPDARDPNGVRLGEEAVLKVVGDCIASEPEDIIDCTFKHLYKFTQGVPVLDDLTLLVLKS